MKLTIELPRIPLDHLHNTSSILPDMIPYITTEYSSIGVKLQNPTVNLTMLSVMST